MPKVSFPYGHAHLDIDIPEHRFAGSLVSRITGYQPAGTPDELVARALESPIGTPRLSAMARWKRNVVLIASDHTRPVPSKNIVPAMLREIRSGNPDAEITILVATGCHRETTREEIEAKFGPEITSKEHIVVHDCDDTDHLVSLGELPSGGELVINKLVTEADLVVAEGFIEPHFFAGFSGGRKSIMPGVASRKTVIYNHNAELIDDPRSRTGVIEGNRIHNDMLYAARIARLDFIVNVVIDSAHDVIYAVAGDLDLAHAAGRNFLLEHCEVHPVPSDIVITTNGGYPLDQNIYQAVKGMTAAEATINEGGVTIMLSKCDDGHGGETFWKTFRDEPDLRRMMDRFMATPPEDTIIDQWQSQIFARLLMRSAVVFVSDAPDDLVRELHMTPAHSLDEALKIADELLSKRGIKNAKILAIPDGVSVIVR